MKYIVFIVDDDMGTGAAYCMALRRSPDFEAQAFACMEDANLAAGTRRPSILLADIRLDTAPRAQVRDATEYLAPIRAGATNFDRRVPVVLFTGRVPELGVETYKRAIRLGASDLLVKERDITPDTAKAVLKRVLDKTRADDEVIAVLERAKELTGAQAFPTEGSDGAIGGEITFEDVIKHFELDDEFARRFRVGLMSIVLAMMRGSSPKQT